MINLDELYNDGEIVAKILEIYKPIMVEVYEGKNLENHLKFVQADINTIDNYIDQAKKENNSTEAFEKLKKEFLLFKEDLLAKINSRTNQI